MSHRTRAETAVEAAAAGASVARAAFRTAIDVETKDGRSDVVTRADRDAQERCVAAVGASHPDEPVVGEEGDGPKTVPEAGPAWVIDPIDGTNNFVRGLPTWATSVACVVDREVVAAATRLPVLGDAYAVGPSGPAERNDDPIAVSDVTHPHDAVVVPTVWWDLDSRGEYGTAVRGIVERFNDLRRFGCAQAALAAVADGSVEAAFSTVRAHPWDVAAGAALVERAGGRATDLAGDPWRPGAEGIVASNGHLHEAVLECAREARRARD